MGQKRPKAIAEDSLLFSLEVRPALEVESLGLTCEAGRRLRESHIKKISRLRFKATPTAMSSVPSLPSAEHSLQLLAASCAQLQRQQQSPPFHAASCRPRRRRQQPSHVVPALSSFAPSPCARGPVVPLLSFRPRDVLAPRARQCRHPLAQQ